MATEHQWSNDAKGEVSSKPLKIIRNVRFTDREIDIIACLLGGRAYKKIASILVISPKTVELHVRNIMLKLGCNSREGIIDFIEKSDKFALVKAHYSSVLIKTIFEQELKKLLPITKDIKLNCLIFHYERQITKSSFVYQLEAALDTVGIKTYSKMWVKDKSISFIRNKIGIKHVNCIVYALSGAFEEHICEIYKEVTDLIPILQEGLCPIIFLLLEDKNSLDVNKRDPNTTYLSLAETGNYYFLVFELLKKILPDMNIDANIIAFKKRHEMLQGDSKLQKWPKDDFVAEPDDIIDKKRKKKKTYFKWATFFFVFFISIIFAVFRINNERESLNSQLQNIKHKITNNRRNLLLENQLKTTVFNLPPRNSKFIGREAFFGQIKKQLDKEKVKVICGLGGVGKTQLAMEYAYREAEKNDYGVILWISAENRNTINGTYKELASFLQIDVKGVNPDKIQGLVQNELSKNNQGGKILFILDNVPNYSVIKNYIIDLHRQLSPSLTPHILITSRSQYWPEGDPLIIDTFTPEEAVIFIKQHLQNEQEDEVTKLAKTLQYFPLALSQAVAYIKAHTNISDYIKLYSSKQRVYLDKYSDNETQYKESLWKTWNIGLNKLSSKAKEILFVSSYLYPDDIQLDLFNNLTVEERADAIEDLRKHSFIIITNSNKSFRIHRLLQDVIRTSIMENNGGDLKNHKNISDDKLYVLIKAINLLKRKFNFSYSKYDNWNLCGQYLNHAQSLAAHAINAKNESLNVIGLQLYAQAAMYYTYVEWNMQSAQTVLNNILSWVVQHYNNDPSYKLLLANIYIHLGWITYYQTGSKDDAEKYFKQTLVIYESKISDISTDINKILYYLRWGQTKLPADGIKCDHSFVLYRWGIVKSDSADYNAAKNLYVQALSLLDKCSEKNATIIYKSLLLLELSRVCRDPDVDIKEIENALNLATKNINTNLKNHLLLVSYGNFSIADYLYYIGSFDGAKEAAERGLKVALLAFSKNHYLIGMFKLRLAVILCATNNVTESIINLKEVEQIYNLNFKKEHLYFALLYLRMNQVYEMNKEYGLALHYLIEAQKLLAKRWGAKTNIYLSHYFTPFEKLPLLKPSETNVHYYEQALDIIKMLFGENHIRAGRYHYIIGQIYENCGNKEKAKKHYGNALSIFNKQYVNNKLLTLYLQKTLRVIYERLRKL